MKSFMKSFMKQQNEGVSLATKFFQNYFNNNKYS